MGLYRFCKYRTGFTDQSMKRLQNMRQRFEVAADTIHPHWRQMLSIIGINSEPVYRGHPHDWVVSRDRDPVPLASTYLERIPDFSFQHLETAVIDEAIWGPTDPREVKTTATNARGQYICEQCGNAQCEGMSSECRCFPDLFGSGRRIHCPVQVFQTSNGRNNGLISCCVSTLAFQFADPD